MKILITTDTYTNMVNGVTVSVHNLYSALKEDGHDVRILTLSSIDMSYPEGNVYYIRSQTCQIYPDARWTWSFADPLLEDILDWKPEIIHSQNEFSTFILAKRISQKLNIPIVHTYHTLYEYYTHYFCSNEKLGKKLVALASKFICNQADSVIAPTEKTARLLEDYNVTVPIQVIPTGLSLERFQLPVSDVWIQDYKKTLSIPEDAFVLLTLGRLAKEKNVEFLIQQIHYLKEDDIHLIIVGDGPDRERLERLVEDYELQAHVHFTGMIKPEEVGKYYRLGDVFVSASSSETQGLTYIEAMACGLPLLCFKDQCLQMVLRHGHNGFFFQNSKDFSEHLSELKQIPDFRTTLGHHALETASEYSKETFAKYVVHLYTKTISEREERKLCTRFACIPKLIWPKGTEF